MLNPHWATIVLEKGVDMSEYICEELIEETVMETMELIVEIEDFFSIMLEANEFQFKSYNFDKVMRDIHSVKGSLGMLGHEKYADSVHKVEDFVLKYQQKGNLPKAFVQVMEDFWFNLYQSLNERDNNSGSLFDIENCLNCINSDKNQGESGHKSCQDQHNGLKVHTKFGSIDLNSRDAKVLKRAPIILGGNFPELVSSLGEQYLDFSVVYCLDELYRKLRSLKGVQFIVINLSDYWKITPFVSQSLINTYSPKIEFVYFYDNKKDIIHALEEAEKLPSTICFFKNNSIGINKFVKKIYESIRTP